jgi:hypothetical protein
MILTWINNYCEKDKFLTCGSHELTLEDERNPENEGIVNFHFKKLEEKTKS